MTASRLAREYDPKQIYLGKNGNVFGPFAQAEIEKMHASGHIFEFTWIWDVGTETWKPLDPPPPSLSSRSPEEQRSSIARPISSRMVKSVQGLEVICHDQRNVVSGRLDEVTETGCTLLSFDNAPSPSLCSQTSVFLNLLDPKSGKAMNIRARLFGASRSPEGWNYRVRWNECPSLS